MNEDREKEAALVGLVAGCGHSMRITVRSMLCDDCGRPASCKQSHRLYFAVLVAAACCLGQVKNVD